MTDLRCRILGLSRTSRPVTPARAVEKPAVAALTLALVLPALTLTGPGEAQAAQDPAPQQATVAQSEPTQSEPEQSVAIAATDIQAAAEAVLRTLLDIDASIAGEAEPFEETLQGLRAQFEVLDGRYGALDERTILTRRIGDALNSWAGLQAQVAAPLAAVGGRYDDIQGQLNMLGEFGAVWRATFDSLAAPEGVPADLAATLRDRITQVLGSMVATRGRLQERSGAVLTLQNDFAALSAEIGQKVSYLEQLAAGVRRRLLTRDAPPIWGFGSGDVSGLGDEARDALTDRLEVAERFFAGHSGQAAAHLVAFLVFVAIGFAMRRHVRRWADISGADALYSMLSRPISLAAIFALLAASWFYTTMPTSVVDLFLFVTLVPVMRLAPRLLAAEDRSTLYGMLGLYAAVRVVGLMSQGSRLWRLSMLVLTILALVGLVRFVRRRLRPMIEGRGVVWKAAALVMRLAAPMLFAAVVANLLGWVRLSWVITSGTVLSAYAAVILWLFGAGASGIAAVLPMTRLGDVLPSLRHRAADVTRVLVVVVQLTALWIWLDATLKWLLLREPVAARLQDLISFDVGLGGFQITVGDVLAAVLVLIVTPLISRVVRFFFMEEVRPRLSLPIGAADGVASLMNYVILTIGALVAATAAGFDATQLTVVLGALGVGIGFGLQNIVSNFISGLILIFERPISVGDHIAVGVNQQVGVVTRIGIRASTVRTFDGSEIVVPNSDLISKEVTNWTLSDMQRRLEMKLNVEYGTDPRRLLELLTRVAEEHPAVLSEPSSRAVFDGFGESWLAFRLLYWVPMDDLLRIKTEMNLAVNDALNAAEVKIAIPRRRLEIRNPAEDAKD